MPAAALDELGIEPGAKLRELERQVLAQDAALDLVPQRLRRGRAGSAPRPARSGVAVSLRRPRERGGQASHVARACGGRRGRPGAADRRARRGQDAAGARPSRTRLRASGALVLYGVSDAVVSTPYQPLREWLEFLLRVCEPDVLKEALGSEGGQLARLVPELEALGIVCRRRQRRRGRPLPPAEGGDETAGPAQSSATVAPARRRPPLGRHRDAGPAPPARTRPRRSRGCSWSLPTAIPARRSALPSVMRSPTFCVSTR